MSLKNERVQFYLRHRKQLEEWFDLRSEVAEAVDSWLSGLAGDLESLAPELGDDVLAINNTGGSIPGLYLKRQSWPGKKIDQQPLVGLEWTRRRALLGQDPYVCVRCDRKTGTGSKLADDVQFHAVRKQLKYSSTAVFPAWRFVVPMQELPEGEDEYRALLLDAIREAWTSFAPFIDAATQKQTERS